MSTSIQSGVLGYAFILPGRIYGWVVFFIFDILLCLRLDHTPYLGFSMIPTYLGFSADYKQINDIESPSSQPPLTNSVLFFLPIGTSNSPNYTPAPSTAQVEPK
jgi:hypothetical protein